MTPLEGDVGAHGILRYPSIFYALLRYFEMRYCGIVLVCGMWYLAIRSYGIRWKSHFFSVFRYSGGFQNITTVVSNFNFRSDIMVFLCFWVVLRYQLTPQRPLPIGQPGCTLYDLTVIRGLIVGVVFFYNMMLRTIFKSCFVVIIVQL